MKNMEFLLPDQVTAQYDADAQVIKVMRSKEDAADYRFSQEPDIPWLDVSDLKARTSVDISLLPTVVEEELITGGVRPQDAKFFSGDKERSRVVIGLNEGINDIKAVATVLMNNVKTEEYSKLLKIKALQLST